MSKNFRFEFVTDTATLCVFDLQSMKHRLGDDADWWSIPEEELLEVNRGNAMFVGLGQDGRYAVEVSDPWFQSGVMCVLNCPSGRMFVGAGEEVTSDGLEPEAIRGGGFLDLKPGSYEVHCGRQSGYVIALAFEKNTGSLANDFRDLLRL